MDFDFSMLASPAALLGLLCGFIAIGLVLFQRSAAFLGLGLLFFGGSIGVIAEGEVKYGSLTYGFLFPLQANRHILYLGGGALCILAAAMHGSRRGLARPPAAVLLVVLLGVYAGAMQFVHADIPTAVATIATALVSLGGATLLMAAAAQTFEECMGVLRMLCFVAIVWIVAALLQVGMDPAAVTLGNRSRFCGLSPNPQQAAAFLAVVNITALFLLFNDSRLRYRPLWIGLLVAALPLLGWTGSRTGALMLAIGALPILYRRFGKMVLLLPIVGGGLVLVASLLQQPALTDSLERLTSTENTRAEAWQALIDTATESPWVGVGVRYLIVSENSLLYAFAAYGVGALLILLLVTLCSAVQVIKLIPLLRSDQLARRRAAELCVGYMVMFYAASMFEGFFLARVSVLLPVFIVYSTVAARVIRFGVDSEAAAPPDESEPDETYLDPAPATRYAAEGDTPS